MQYRRMDFHLGSGAQSSEALSAGLSPWKVLLLEIVLGQTVWGNAAGKGLPTQPHELCAFFLNAIFMPHKMKPLSDKMKSPIYFMLGFLEYHRPHATVVAWPSETCTGGSPIWDSNVAVVSLSDEILTEWQKTV